MHVKSIHASLTRWIFGLLTLFTPLFGIVLYCMIKWTVVSNFDDTVYATAQAVASSAENEGRRIEYAVSEIMKGQFQHSDQPGYFEIRMDNGDWIASSESMDHQFFNFNWADADWSPKWFDLILPDGREGRAVYFRFSPILDEDDFEAAEAAGILRYSRDSTAVILFAQGLEELDTLMFKLFWVMVFALELIPIAAVIIASWTVKRGLLPLESFAHQTAKINGKDLSFRFEVNSFPIEFQQVVERLNGLLARLEAFIQRERRFSGNVAHELRTPLAELHTTAEVALMAPNDTEGLRQALDDSIEIARHMKQMMESLLTLSRSETGIESPIFETIELDTLFEQLYARTLERHQSAIQHKALILSSHFDSSLKVQGDKMMLTSIFENLTSNAIEYTPYAGNIRFVLSNDEQGGLLRIVNDVSTSLTVQDIEHFEEPFWRKDEARTDTAHVGLGLVITSSFCKLMSLELNFKLNPGISFEAVIHFPIQN